MNPLKLLSASLILAALSGCVIHIGDDDSSSSYASKEEKNRRKLAELNVGESQVAVMDRMGEAQFVESFEQGGAQYKVLFYRTHRTHADGDTTRDETTPVVLKDGRVAGVGMDYYQRTTAR